MKEQLARLIEVYADAKATKNVDLLNLATNELNKFLSVVEIVGPPTEEAPAAE